MKEGGGGVGRWQTKGVGPSRTLAWPGWKQPDIPVEVDTARLESSRTHTGKELPGYSVPVPEIIDPVFAKTSPKRWFSMTEYERFGLVFTKTRVYEFGHRALLSVLYRTVHLGISFFGAMLVRPRPMCPRPIILGCCIPWKKCPLAIVPLTEPSHL